MALNKSLAIGLVTGLLAFQPYALPAHAADGPGWGPGHGMMWAGPTHNWFGWGMSAHFCGEDGKQNIKLFMGLIDRTIAPTEAQKPGEEAVRPSWLMRKTTSGTLVTD